MKQKIPLAEWAARHYSPPPSLWTLRKWARNGQLWPAPEIVGKHYYVSPDTIRVTGERTSLVERLMAEA